MGREEVSWQALLFSPTTGSKTGCCPRNWENFRESCYWTSLQRLSWDNARLDCEKKSSHLVILNSPEEKVGRPAGPS